MTATATATRERRPSRVTPQSAKTELREVDEAIGRRLRFYRTMRQMSQETLADKLGISFQQVQKYEKGTNRLAGSRLAQVCRKLGITPNDLLGFDGKRVSTIAKTVELFIGEHGKDGLHLIDALTLAPKSVARSVFNLIHILIAQANVANARGRK